MNSRLQTPLIVLIAVIIAVGSFTYGALTAPRHQTEKSPAPSAAPRIQLSQQLTIEKPTINGVLVAAYPKIATDYAIINEQLYDQGKWYGAVLTYKGTDTANRDSLRVLMQKKEGIWVLRTTPPQPILSAQAYPDVPKSILQSINKPVALP